MSPRSYGFLWILFFVSAVILWLAGVLGLTAIIAFGFIIFGLVFTGMMCVLPGQVSHPAVKPANPRTAKKSQPKSSSGPVVVAPVNV